MDSPADHLPIFPEFKPLALEDQALFRRFLWDYQPETSELTFTNLFIWKDFYHFSWSLEKDWLLIVGQSPEGRHWGLPPIGPSARAETCGKLLRWLEEEQGAVSPSIERADRRLLAELAHLPEYTTEPLRDHFDYLYRSADLIQIPGHKYRIPRNHIHQVQRSYAYHYEPLQERHLPACLDLAGVWCDSKRCAEDLGLLGEWEAVKSCLSNFQELNLQGGVILIDDQVAAFTLGELLNQETAVIHIEKANPLISGLFAVINQAFCQQAWAQVPFINREQDLGVPGLRTAKLAYHPAQLVEKFRLHLTDARI